VLWYVENNAILRARYVIVVQRRSGKAVYTHSVPGGQSWVHIVGGIRIVDTKLSPSVYIEVCETITARLVVLIFEKFTWAADCTADLVNCKAIIWPHPTKILSFFHCR
jgi:hypothetical protein